MHLLDDHGGGDHAQDGRDERIVGQPCRSGDAHRCPSSAEQDPTVGKVSHRRRLGFKPDGQRAGQPRTEFEALYTDFGRLSIAPERRIRASLIRILVSDRSACQFMEQMQHNLLFRCCLGLGIDDPAWVPTVVDPRTMTGCGPQRQHETVCLRSGPIARSYRSFRTRILRSAGPGRRPPTLRPTTTRAVRPALPKTTPSRHHPGAPHVLPHPPVPQHRRRLPGREAHKRHPSLDDRRRRVTLMEVPRPWRGALLQGGAV